MPIVPSEWNLRYARWVIDDGEPDRGVGESFEWFAIEFWSESGLALAKAANETTATPVADFRYCVTAKITHLSAKAAVIDFGLTAIGPRDLLPPECSDGDYVTGDVVIGLPLCTDVVPEEVLQTLKRTWHVNRISADLTPYISHPDDPTGRWQIQDMSRMRYEQVSSTDSVITHSYVLHCSEGSMTA